MIALAAGDAVTKMVKEIVPEPVQKTNNAPVVERKKKSFGLKKLLVPVIVGLAVGLIASSGSDSSSSSGDIDQPPVSPF